ncbi:MAG: lamin tail domain-containing protein [Patescibacteria group bacterium]
MRRSKFICRWVLISQTAVMLFVTMPAPEAKADGAVFISEVAWAGSTLSAADEWIELYNPTDIDSDVGGWRLVGAGSSGHDIVLPSGTMVPAGGALLLANYEPGDEKTALTVEAGIATSTLSLSNSALMIELFDADGVLVDFAGDGGAPPAGSSGDVKQSMQRIDFDLPGDADEAWASAEVSVNLTTEDLGDPGIIKITETVNADDDMTATSTLPFLDSATSTDSVSTSTIVIIEPIATSTLAATSTGITPTTEIIIVSTSTILDEPQIGNTSSYQKNQIRQFLRLNEVMAAPLQGKEWIELVNLSLEFDLVLDDLEVHDQTGRIIKLEGKILPGSPYLAAEISASKLNNSGDSVYLRFSDGELIDTLTYAAHDKGTVLARDEKHAWQYSVTPTPGAANVITEQLTDTGTDDYEESSKINNTETKPVGISATIINSAAAADTGTTTDNLALADPQTMHKPILSEIMPNPNEGKEWIEVICTEKTMPRQNIEIFDATGKIFSLPDNVCRDDGVYVHELSSARLNNTGDEVSLRLADGTVLDSIRYEGSQKGFSFALQADGSWLEINDSSPGESAAVFTTEKAIGAAIDATGSTADIKDDGKSGTVISTKSKTASVKTTKSTTAKAKGAAKADIILKIKDFYMLHNEQFGGSRVLLQGTVGTMPRQTTGRSFVLLNGDGRGLLVSVPSHRKLPEMGSFIEITGTLKFNTYELPYLSVTVNDGWTVRRNYSENPQTRDVSFLAPALEDGWSLVTASGTVTGVSGNTIDLIVDDVDVKVKVKSGVAYRAGRLKKDDVISVSGVLDITDDIPVIIPRTADEIQLIHSSTLAAATQTSSESGLPGWTPFGAAFIAVGALEVVKKVKTKFKKEKADLALQKNALGR